MNSLVNRNLVVENLLRNVVPEFYARPAHRPAGAAPERRVSIDVLDLGHAYQVEAELPGLEREAIKVGIEGKVVTLSADYRRAESGQPEASADNNSPVDAAPVDGRAASTPVAEVAVLHAERGWGKVSRVLQLPVEVDASQAKARYVQGVLTLTLPKLARSSVQQLTIE